MKIRANLDAVIGIGTVVFTGFTWLVSRKFPYEEMKAGMGPAFFPHLIIAVLGSLGILLYLVSVFKRSDGDSSNIKKSELNTIIMIVFLVVYALLFKYLGFTVSTLIYLVSSFLLLKVRLVTAILSTVLTLGIFYLVFVVMFKIPLI